MQLDLGSGESIKNPNKNQIGIGLASLRGGVNSFAILSKDENTYMQVHGSSVGGFLLEYQDGSVNRHFRSPAESLQLQEVMRAFDLYLSDDDRWRTDYPWEASTPAAIEIYISQPSYSTGSRGWWLGLLAISVVVLSIITYYMVVA